MTLHALVGRDRPRRVGIRGGPTARVGSRVTDRTVVFSSVLSITIPIQSRFVLILSLTLRYSAVVGLPKTRSEPPAQLVSYFDVRVTHHNAFPFKSQIRPDLRDLETHVHDYGV